MILSCFVLGLLVRKVSEAPPVDLRPADQPDAVVAVSLGRPLQDQYRVLMLDGMW
jgi:hypothetical protein